MSLAKRKERNKQELSPAYTAPEWAKHVVWYQIFPERFRNGDPSNDPTAKRIGAPEGWEISTWTSDWYSQTEWEKSLGDTFLDSVFDRRYGGDLQGIIDKLDYLQDLGIGAIYLNPIFDAVSLHKYDTSYYHHVDRFFGPDPEGDAAIIEQEDPNDPSTWQWTAADKLFIELIEEVHKRGMKIVIDGVFNHTGVDFWAFRDLLEHQQDSKYKDWYAVQSFRENSDDEFLYDSWWNVKSLPALNERDGTLVEPVRKHIFEITRRWMDPDGDGDPSDGIDGWRLDVPEEVGKGFWKEWNALVQSINPDAITIGEIWTTKSTEWVNGELFISSMNYPFTNAVINYMLNQSITASEFLSELRNFRQQFPDQAEFVLQNLMDSHDTPRLASMVVEANRDREFGKNTKPKEGFEVRKPNSDERRIQKLIALFQYTYVGAPMIFYGTESGMWGADDPDDRKPMVWEEFTYDAEVAHPLKKERPVDDNNFDKHIFNWYKKLGRIRNEHLALRKGFFKELMVDNEQNVLAFVRFLNDNMFVIVVLNRSEEPHKIRVPINHFEAKEGKHMENLVTGSQFEIQNGHVEVTLPPVSGAILAPEDD